MTDELKSEGTEGNVGENLVVAEGDELSNEHAEIRRQALSLRDRSANAYWDISVVLHQIFHESLYHGWGFESFQEYVEKELDWCLAKGKQLVNLQDWFDKISDERIKKWMQSLGYAKARILKNVVTLENADEWRNRVDGKTLVEIQAMLRDAREEDVDTSGDGEENSVEKASNFTVKVFPKQRENLVRAFDLGKDISGSEKDGHVADLIATEFLSTHNGIDNVQEYLRSVERICGVNIIAYDSAGEKMIFGSGFIQELEKRDREEEPQGE